MEDNLKIKLIENLIKREGGYVNDHADSGGETNYGITLNTARAYGYGGAIVDLPRSMAFDIYIKLYWNPIKGDDLLSLSPAICEEVFDTNVNLPYGKAAKFLQLSLKVLGNLPVQVDGWIGQETLYALKNYLSVREEKTLLKALNCLQGAFYINLADTSEKNEKFLYGWLRNRVII